MSQSNIRTAKITLDGIEFSLTYEPVAKEAVKKGVDHLVILTADVNSSSPAEHGANTSFEDQKKVVRATELVGEASGRLNKKLPGLEVKRYKSDHYSDDIDPVKYSITANYPKMRFRSIKGFFMWLGKVCYPQSQENVYTIFEQTQEILLEMKAMLDDKAKTKPADKATKRLGAKESEAPDYNLVEAFLKERFDENGRLNNGENLLDVMVDAIIIADKKVKIERMLSNYQMAGYYQAGSEILDEVKQLLQEDGKTLKTDAKIIEVAMAAVEKASDLQTIRKWRWADETLETALNSDIESIVIHGNWHAGTDYLSVCQQLSADIQASVLGYQEMGEKLPINAKMLENRVNRVLASEKYILMDDECVRPLRGELLDKISQVLGFDRSVSRR